MTSQNIVLVTGGNNGIGHATCELFAKQAGYHTIMASRSLEKGQKALSSIQASSPPGSISLVQLDINSDDSIAAAVKEVQSKHGRLDTLINNAGICPTDFTRESLRSSLETNAVSPSMVTLAFAPLLQKSGSPRIVYVSSQLGSITLRSDPSNLAYNEDYKVYRTSKAALNMLAACDAWEYGKKGFKVFAYCPGYVISDLAGMREAKEKSGFAKQPDGSARGLLLIAEGNRDQEHGRFLHDEQPGQTYAW